jgi:hypothetical protein
LPVFISPQKSGTTSIGKALQLCGLSCGGWQPDIFDHEQYSYLILANRLVAQYQSVGDIPMGVRCYLMRKLDFLHRIAHTKDCWDDWPLAHECIDPILKKIVIPEAKFIFSLRDPDSWLRSMAAHYETVEFDSYGSFQDYWKLQYALWLQRMLYLKQEFPDDVLLFNIQDGWKTLCPFLGLKKPRKPFPKENVRFKSTYKQI